MGTGGDLQLFIGSGDKRRTRPKSVSPNDSVPQAHGTCQAAQPRPLREGYSVQGIRRHFKQRGGVEIVIELSL